jgi:hypothetical protein
MFGIGIQGIAAAPDVSERRRAHAGAPEREPRRTVAGEEERDSNAFSEGGGWRALPLPRRRVRVLASYVDGLALVPLGGGKLGG